MEAGGRNEELRQEEDTRRMLLDNLTAPQYFGCISWIVTPIDEIQNFWKLDTILDNFHVLRKSWFSITMMWWSHNDVVNGIFAILDAGLENTGLTRGPQRGAFTTSWWPDFRQVYISKHYDELGELEVTFWRSIATKTLLRTLWGRFWS